MLADLLKIPSTSRANIKKKPLNIGLVNTFLWARGASQKKRNYKRDVIGTLRLTIPSVQVWVKYHYLQPLIYVECL